MVANITNDISLLRQIREGNEDAFKSLFETYFTPLCRFIYLHLDDKNVAEELAMDILFIYGKTERHFRSSFRSKPICSKRRKISA